MLDYRQHSHQHQHAIPPITMGTSTMHLKAHIPATFHFEERIVATRPRLARIARALGIPADAVDDLLQDTWLAAWRQFDQLRAYKNFDAWLGAICRNRCRIYLRTHGTAATSRRPIVLSLDAALDDGGALGIDPFNAQVLDPVEELDKQELSQLLDHALGRLTMSAREVLELRYVREMPEGEAASSIGVSVGALEARLHRARRQLRGVLSGPMRTEAEAFGLVSHAEYSTIGWQETRLWCNLCGRRRLHGTFIRQTNGTVHMRMRCSDCSPRYNFDIYGDKGQAKLQATHSYRPALNRVMRTLASDVLARLPSATVPCHCCGQFVPVRVVVPESHQPTSSNGPANCWIAYDCPKDGSKMLHSAVEPVVWFHPLAQRFMREHPHWITLPESVVEYVGRPTVRFRLADVASSAQLIALADPVTLQLLTVFED